MIYLTKFLAQAGIASRRQAETLIRQKKVKVNGEIAELGMKVSGEEEIKVRGKKISNDLGEKMVIALNKPKGYTCTNRKFAGEDNIFQLLPAKFSNLIIAGRLDKNSHGLVLLTNDGNLANQITHPRFGHDKEYLVRFAGEERMSLGAKDLYERAKAGVKSDDGEILHAKAIRETENGFSVVLSEGRKRHIRRLFAGMGLKVSDLKRVKIGKFELDKMPLGKHRKLTEEEIKQILK